LVEGRTSIEKIRKVWVPFVEGGSLLLECLDLFAQQESALETTLFFKLERLELHLTGLVSNRSSTQPFEESVVVASVRGISPSCRGNAVDYFRSPASYVVDYFGHDQSFLEQEGTAQPSAALSGIYPSTLISYLALLGYLRLFFSLSL